MSDHLSGHRALSEPAIDLTDLNAFPSPSRRGYFVLVLNVFPMARPGALFSDGASYRLRLRPVTTTPSGLEVATREYAFTCTFAAQAGTCILPNGAAVSFRHNEMTASDPDGVRIFAGLRVRCRRGSGHLRGFPGAAGTARSRGGEEHSYVGQRSRLDQLRARYS